MPREHNQRGRRAEKKRKLDENEHDAADGASSPKRQHTEADDHSFAVHTLLGQQQHIADQDDEASQVFYGVLDEEEQEYFRKANEMLELNSFGTPDERLLFVNNVFQEAQAKELKLANSQSGSRLLERLIQLATTKQLKDLFQKFSGHFANLVQHRFASHCCEKLFIKAAPLVTQEFLHPPKPDISAASVNDVFVTMEDLFLSTVNELQKNIGFLMTDRFATHTLRVLLLILAGEPASSPLMKAILQSKRKEDVSVNGVEDGTDQPGKLSVPESFTETLQTLITASMAGLDTHRLRSLAKHHQANPFLQLLLRIELTHFGKSRGKDQDSVIRRLLPDDTISPDSESASFINDLMYDSIGSHLVETVVEFAPAKLFKSLFKDFFRDRMAALARNDIASYVACKVLERLSRDDLITVHETIVPTMPKLLELNRINVIRTLIERCSVRKVETQGIAMQIQNAFSDGESFDVLRLLHFQPSDDPEGASNGETPAKDEHHQPSATPAQIQGGILAQTMIIVPGPLSSLVLDSLPLLPPATLQQMARTGVNSRTLQAAMRSVNASIISRRKLIQQFYGHAGAMATHPTASHVVDAIWDGTFGLAFIRERVAEELAENESLLRESPHGRAVWRNWQMDLYRRRRAQWVAQSRNQASDDGFQAFSAIDKNRVQQEKSGVKHVEQVGRRKTPLELARERHAAKQSAKENVADRQPLGQGQNGSTGGSPSLRRSARPNGVRAAT